MQVDKKMAEAVRIAVRDFGEEVLTEDRLIGVLKDYRARLDSQGEEFIIRTLIKDGSLSMLLKEVKNNSNNFEDYLHRETGKVTRKYGFAKESVAKILASFCVGLGCKEDVIVATKSTVQIIRDEDDNNVGRAYIYRRTNIYKDGTSSDSNVGFQQGTSTNYQSKGSHQNSTGNNTSKNSIKKSYVAFFIVVTLFIVIAISILSHNEKSNTIDVTNTKKELYEDMDTIVTAPDDTLTFPYRKKRRAKGPYRGNDYYDAAYEEGYEDGLADKRFE